MSLAETNSHGVSGSDLWFSQSLSDPGKDLQPTLNHTRYVCLIPSGKLPSGRVCNKSDVFELLLSERLVLLDDSS